jgi:hypothetical protein
LIRELNGVRFRSSWKNVMTGMADAATTDHCVEGAVENASAIVPWPGSGIVGTT